MASDAAKRRYMLQIECPGKRLDLPEISRILSDTGVELDPSYRPILVNPTLGRYVVRASADDQARKRAERIPGVQFFGDLKISPTNF